MSEKINLESLFRNKNIFRHRILLLLLSAMFSLHAVTVIVLVIFLGCGNRGEGGDCLFPTKKTTSRCYKVYHIELCPTSICLKYCKLMLMIYDDVDDDDNNNNDDDDDDDNGVI